MERAVLAAGRIKKIKKMGSMLNTLSIVFAPRGPEAAGEAHTIKKPAHKSCSASHGQVDVLAKAFSTSAEQAPVCLCQV